MSRTASAIICDDIRAEYNSKLIIVGMYPADITIPTVPFLASKLLVLFTVRGSTSEPLRSLTLEVVLPENEPVRVEPPIPQILPPIPPDRKSWYSRQVVQLSPALLRPGRILAKAIHDKGEIEVGLPWIVHVPASLEPVAVT